MEIWIPGCRKKKDGAICRNCRHFYQHYIYACGGYHAVSAGHCGYPRMKGREPYDSCSYFEKR